MRGGGECATRFVVARVAYLTGRKWRERVMAPDALPDIEAADHALIVEAGAAHGVQFEIRYWDDETLPTQGFDAALIRSCWDYPERYDEFLARLAAHERAGVRLFNSAAAVTWNARKTYLKQLGGAAIETIWADIIDAHGVAQAFDAFDAAEIVIKPQVGAGSRNTLRLKRNAWSEADLLDAPPEAAMLQPYLKSIETEGERSLFWFGGEFSHAIRKVPKSGDWFANRPENARFFAEAPPAAAIAVAEAARAQAPADLLYARIDLVLGDDGRWRVIEIEAIEPYLFLAFAPEGAAVLARALSRVLGR
jgi:glutathione synthase/RimK-type ligase-like ATP-grasp enzyme